MYDRQICITLSLLHSKKCWVVSTQIWVKYGQPKCWVKNVINKFTVESESWSWVNFKLHF